MVLIGLVPKAGAIVAGIPHPVLVADGEEGEDSSARAGAFGRDQR